MDGGMEGWINGWMNGGMNGWTDGCFIEMKPQKPFQRKLEQIFITLGTKKKTLNKNARN